MQDAVVHFDPGMLQLERHHIEDVFALGMVGQHALGVR